MNIRAVRELADGIVEIVRDTGENGAPAGIMYLAFLAHNIPLEVFEDFMGALVKAGRLKKKGDLYFAMGLGSGRSDHD